LIILDDSIELGAMNLVVAGGEPLLRKDIFKVLNYATDLGMYTEVLTNGTLLTKELVKKMKEASVDSVRISIDYADKSKFDQWRGQKDAFDRIIRSIKLLKESSMFVGINSTIVHDNVNEINNLMQLGIKENVNYIRFAPLVNIGKASLLSMMSRDDWARIASAVMDCAEKYKEFVKFADYKEIPPLKEVPDLFAMECTAGSTSINIMPDGTIRGCPYLPPENVSLKDKRLTDVWRDSFSAYRNVANSSLGGKCKNCYLKACKGGCIAERIISGDINNEQPICIREILSDVLSDRHTYDSRMIVSRWLDNIYLKQLSCIRNLPVWVYLIKN
jgi:radical SAM protein with 4Fe4S-binding SPASM domain